MRPNNFMFMFGTFVLVSANCASGAVINQKLAAGEKTIQNVCLMPIEAEWAKVGIKGTEGMTKEAEAWTTRMRDVVVKAISGQGVEVASETYTPVELQANEKLREVLLQLQQKYDSVAAQLNKKPNDIKKGRYSLGDEVTLLPCAAKADALVFTHSQGHILTGGKKAFGVLVAGASRSTAELRLTMVDAKSGEALAYTRIRSAGDKFRNDPDKAYSKGLTKELQKMQLGKQAGAKKK